MRERGRKGQSVCVCLFLCVCVGNPPSLDLTEAPRGQQSSPDKQGSVFQAFWGAEVTTHTHVHTSSDEQEGEEEEDVCVATRGDGCL